VDDATQMADELKLVLASQSPRRMELLRLGELPFATRPTDIDESVREGETAQDYVQRLAEEKARAAAKGLDGANLVLAADTTVEYEGQILAKPANAAEARAMLENLRGRSHMVYTAIALLNTEDGALRVDVAETEVPMRDYSEAEMEAYIATGDPFDKAGAYAIQHDEFHPVDGLAGCYANVVGLPLCHVTRNLAKWGAAFATDIPTACQAHLGYDCPVFNEVLNWEQ
jgi:septum formation protein